MAIAMSDLKLVSAIAVLDVCAGVYLSDSPIKESIT
jgi:hypothetical protein